MKRFNHVAPRHRKLYGLCVLCGFHPHFEFDGETFVVVDMGKCDPVEWDVALTYSTKKENPLAAKLCRWDGDVSFVLAEDKAFPATKDALKARLDSYYSIARAERKVFEQGGCPDFRESEAGVKE